MKTLVVLLGAVFSATYICMGVAQEDTPPKPESAAPARDDAAKPAAPKAKGADKAKSGDESDKSDKSDKPAATPAEKPSDRPVTESSVPAKNAPDEQAIRKIHEELVKGYASDDAKAVAAHFGEDGEYINAQGTIFQGRAEIQESLNEYMTEHPGCQLESRIDAIRFVGPTVALVDGITSVAHEESQPVHCHFAAVYVKSGDKWQVASIRDRLVVPVLPHEEQLAQLDFLQGEWVDEEAHSVVAFSCKPTDNGKFLLREFTLKIAGQDMLKGSQRIGWDPMSGTLRTWIFDSEGGFADGVWEHAGDEWILHASGVTAEGEAASGSTIYKVIDDRRMTWQAVDHEVGGVPVEDSPVFTLTRRAPSPTEENGESVGLKETNSR